MSINIRIDPPNCILLIKPSSLGDILHALPVLKAIRDRWPEAKITWVVKEVYSGILEKNPHVDKLILLKNNSLTTRILSFREKLQKESFDIAVDMQGLFRSGLISYLSGAPIRVGFHNARECAPMFYTHKVEAPLDLHAVDRNLKLADLIGCETNSAALSLDIDSRSIREVSEFFQKKQLDNKNPLIILVPGARWEKKRWPIELFAKLGTLLVQRLKANIIITGSGLEKRLIDKIYNEMKAPSIVAIDLPLSNLSALIKMSDVVVSNDSGPMHIAASVGTPVVALFGPTDPGRTGPYSKKCLVIQKNMECVPCFRKPCIHDSFICMESINVEEAFDGVKLMLIG